MDGGDGYGSMCVCVRERERERERGGEGERKETGRQRRVCEREERDDETDSWCFLCWQIDLPTSCMDASPIQSHRNTASQWCMYAHASSVRGNDTKSNMCRAPLGGLSFPVPSVVDHVTSRN